MQDQQLQIILPDGSKRDVASGTAVYDVIADLDADLKQGTIGVCIDEAMLDLQSPVTTAGELKLVKMSDDTPATRVFYRHSFSHILAQAVKRLFPEAKLAIGPAIAEGFYYDFDVPTPFKPEDLEKITVEMKKIVKEKHKFERTEMSLDEAKQFFKEQGEIYKLELLEDIADRDEKITCYKDGEFVDLCRGPHVRSTAAVKHFKLLDLAGAYWRGDENNKMLQRIYGTAFAKKEDLEQHLWKLEEAKKRDHRRIGKDLDLFSIHPENIGPGLILWHPKAGLIRHLIEAHCKERHLEGGYDFVYTPHIGRSTLWQTSGHLDFYREDMYAPMDIEGQEYFLKPMNCPFHVYIYKDRLRSYRELPLRWAEWGTVYRYEKSGVTHGLVRVRGFTQDDAHLFCSPDQMPAEIDKALEFSLSLLRDFGLKDFHLYLSTRPEKRVGEDKNWDAAEAALKHSLDQSGLPYSVNAGDGAFYGPKIDICCFDALERKWQLTTIQFDFNLPERFDLNFIGEDGEQHRPYMIHRALLGSMERFFGILIEHYAGAFPVWLAPTQIVVLPIAERHQDYAHTVLAQLKEKRLRAELDSSSNTLGYRIRDAQNQKIPFMLVIGDREVEEKTVAVRQRNGQDLGALAFDAFFDLAQQKILAKEAI
ncbi:threonine--tRNA ligase [Oligoflexia bacterium]|nr:threonine--tRNA ligase [Oligoflexia bacterium]